MLENHNVYFRSLWRSRLVNVHTLLAIENNITSAWSVLPHKVEDGIASLLATLDLDQRPAIRSQVRLGQPRANLLGDRLGLGPCVEVGAGLGKSPVVGSVDHAGKHGQGREIVQILAVPPESNGGLLPQGLVAHTGLGTGRGSEGLDVVMDGVFGRAVGIHRRRRCQRRRGADGHKQPSRRHVPVHGPAGRQHRVQIHSHHPLHGIAVLLGVGDHQLLLHVVGGVQIGLDGVVHRGRIALPTTRRADDGIELQSASISTASLRQFIQLLQPQQQLRRHLAQARVGAGMGEGQKGIELVGPHLGVGRLDAVAAYYADPILPKGSGEGADQRRAQTPRRAQDEGRLGTAPRGTVFVFVVVCVGIEPAGGCRNMCWTIDAGRSSCVAPGTAAKGSSGTCHDGPVSKINK